MKFFISQVPELLIKIEKDEISSLLLYGPNKGYINYIQETLIKKFHFLKKNLDFEFFKFDSLNIIANSHNFFMQKECIKVKLRDDRVTSSLKVILEKKNLHFLIFIFDELNSNSPIKKFFELSNNLGSLGCYYDDPSRIKKIIEKKCKDNNKVLDFKSIEYLSNIFNNDHQILVNELDKLFSYSIKEEIISFQDVKSIITACKIGNLNLLCESFALEEKEIFLQECYRLKNQHINEVLIIRSLIKFYLKIYQILFHLFGGQSFEEAVEKLYPKVFYKQVPTLKRIIKKANSDKVITILNLLQEAELIYKRNPLSFDFYYSLYNRISNKQD